ncbi:ARM repeat-containing protein [Anaeromyces robustus]|uniref:ARM repeat-containing protein n=1 Tax=Anaeromyces robustus TaxID=1754192 RepID=A0A1Y1VSH2_9FUNG|nr:ARM repeat-containing protein [Anaeromyces robustus]|eukprot:ORX64229.1 ARM repeat-containing protein [Anaeromyces robustus]
MIDDVALKLNENYSVNVKAKVLWILGEMGLNYPVQIKVYIEDIAGYLKNSHPKLRERAVNALGRIGRADKNLVIPYMDKLMEMRKDKANNVRLAFIWACENIATNAPELFYEKMEWFYKLISDQDKKVRIEAPEMFRVMGKRKPQYVKPYLEKLQVIADNDENRVVRIHSAGAIRITKKALNEIENAVEN